jgi:hypothetical protein
MIGARIDMQSPSGGIPGMLLLILGLLVVFVIVVFIVVSRSKQNKKRPSIAGPGAPTPHIDQQRRTTGEFVKRCPTCQSIFTDETLAFCLSDGSTLEHVARTFASNDPNATLVYREADRSDVPPTVQYHPDMSSNKKG